jgi:hypothetical protein
MDGVSLLWVHQRPVAIIAGVRPALVREADIRQAFVSREIQAKKKAAGFAPSGLLFSCDTLSP